MVGISWDLADTALTIMNPAYGLYRVFGGKGVTSGDNDGPAPVDIKTDMTKIPAYKRAMDRGAAASQTLAAAQQRLSDVKSAPKGTYTPITTTLPSFSLAPSAPMPSLLPAPTQPPLLGLPDENLVGWRRGR